VIVKMSITYTNLNYNNEFITCLKKEVDDKIAFVANKDYKGAIYNLGVSDNVGKYSDLIQMSEILDKILKCNSCYSENNIKVEDVISIIKSRLNKC